jgi:hypothetical protein
LPAAVRPMEEGTAYIPGSVVITFKFHNKL